MSVCSFHQISVFLIDEHYLSVLFSHFHLSVICLSFHPSVLYLRSAGQSVLYLSFNRSVLYLRSAGQSGCMEGCAASNSGLSLITIGLDWMKVKSVICDLFLSSSSSFCTFPFSYY